MKLNRKHQFHFGINVLYWNCDPFLKRPNNWVENNVEEANLEKSLLENRIK